MDKLAISVGFAYQGIPYYITFSVDSARFNGEVKEKGNSNEAIRSILIGRLNLDETDFELVEVRGFRFIETDKEMVRE